MNDAGEHPFDTDNRSPVDEYLNLVEARVLTALQSEAVQQSCSTTLLLVFAAFDALGKLTHPRAGAGPGLRFRHFLSFVGKDYEARSTELWNLRNALVHNVINVESYLSSTELEGWTHLQMIGGSGLIYVNSRQASWDLAEAFTRVKTMLATSDDAAQRAGSRLVWVEKTWHPLDDGPVPTPPPPVRFVHTRCRGEDTPPANE